MTAPPRELFDQAAEAALIGAALLDGAEVLVCPTVQAVQPADFWFDGHRAIWSAIRKVALDGLTPDYITVSGELRKRGQFDDALLTSAITGTPNLAGAEGYAAIVRDWSRRRMVLHAISGVGSSIANDGPFDEELSSALQTLAAAAAIGSKPIRPEGAAAWQIRTLVDAFAPREPLEFAVEGLFARPSLNVVYGAPGCFKSMLLADLGICVAAGVPWLPPIPTVADVLARRTTPVPVLWADFDNGSRRTAERVEALARMRDLDPEATPFFYAAMPTPWLDATDPDAIDALIGRVNDLLAGLVFIDNLGTVSGGADENSAEMIQVLANFRRLAESTGAAVVLVHHQRKSSGFSARAGETLRGHSSIEAALDLALLVEREEGSEQVTARSTKSRGLDVPPFGALFTYEHREGTRELGRARFFGTAVEDTSPGAMAQRAIMGALKDAGEPMTKGALVQAAKEREGVGTNRLRGAIDRMAEDGTLTMTPGVRNAQLYTLTGG